jgi:OOP family OmpA-OmpF porin
MRIFTVLGTLVFALLAAAAQATPPSGMDHVDPRAPCFRWPAVDMDGDGVFDRVDNCVNTKAGCIVDEYGCEVDSDGDGVCDGRDKCPDTPRGVEVDEEGCSEAQRMGTSAPAQPRSDIERELIETGRVRLENIYFETANSRLLPESEATLRDVGQTLEKYPDLKIEVEGHTDTRGWARYNMRLSQARAEAVRSFLLEYHTLKPENYVAKGYGETQPETEERNDEELLRNRRVVLRVLNPDVLPKGVKIEGEGK